MRFSKINVGNELKEYLLNSCYYRESLTPPHCYDLNFEAKYSNTLKFIFPHHRCTRLNVEAHYSNTLTSCSGVFGVFSTFGGNLGRYVFFFFGVKEYIIYDLLGVMTQEAQLCCKS